MVSVGREAALGGLEIPHNLQQFQVVLLAPHQHGTRQGRKHGRRKRSTWLPLDFKCWYFPIKFLAKKVILLVSWVKMKIHHCWHPLDKSTIGPLEKSFRHPWSEILSHHLVQRNLCSFNSNNVHKRKRRPNIARDFKLELCRIPTFVLLVSGFWLM